MQVIPKEAREDTFLDSKESFNLNIFWKLFKWRDMASCVSNVFCQYSSQVYGTSSVQEEETSPCSLSAFEFNKKLIILSYDSLAPPKNKM